MKQRFYDVRWEAPPVHPAGDKALHLLPEQLIAYLQFELPFFMGWCSESAGHDPAQERGLNGCACSILIPAEEPAAVLVPIVKALKIVAAQQLVVIGDGQPAGSGRVKGGNDHLAVLLRQMAAHPVQGVLKFCFVVAGIGDHLAAVAERAGGMAHFDPLGDPA